MSDGTINKIQLPNGNIYDIASQETAIESTYDSNTKTVTLTIVGSLGDADTTEY